MSNPFIVCDNLVKIYKVAGLEVVALQGLDLTVAEGELMGIVGMSGSGKSTLLNILGGLDRPSAGQVVVGERDLLKLPDRALDEYRRTQVGFVWQQTGRNLIPYLSAQENIELPMTLAGLGWRDKRAWAKELLETVGLWEHRHHKLAQLSGGQQQRVAIGVALANKPKLLLGDEPTGELDSATAREILALFRRMNEQYGLTTILVTHDPQIARAVERVVTIRDGRTSSETIRRRGEGATSASSVQAVDDVEAALAQGLQPAELVAHHYEEYVVVDGAGRLQIPPDLREEVGIGDRVTLAATEEGILIKPVRGSNGQTAVSAELDVVAEDEEGAETDATTSGWRQWFSKIGKR
jgi:putative ABC transport system ATP-binding protein